MQPRGQCSIGEESRAKVVPARPSSDSTALEISNLVSSLLTVEAVEYQCTGIVDVINGMFYAAAAVVQNQLIGTTWGGDSGLLQEVSPATGHMLMLHTDPSMGVTH